MSSEAFLHAPSHHELVYVGSNGTTCWCFGFQPTTNSIADRRGPGDRYCIRLVDEIYEVYDLNTLKLPPRGMHNYTIDPPVFTHEDPDAAIMWALMNL